MPMLGGGVGKGWYCIGAELAPVGYITNRLPQNCKQLFMYMNKWDKGVAPAICPCILSAGEY